MAPRITADRVRDLALKLPDTEEWSSYGTPGFRVRGKLFARLLPDQGGLVLRCGFERRAVLLQEEDDIFYITPHYSAWPWVVARLDKIGLKRLRVALDEAWTTAAAEVETKAKKAQRRGPGSPMPPPRSRGAPRSEIDDYLATVDGDKRAALDVLRKAIRSIMPTATECISYGMPAFRLDGAIVAGFQATAKGCSYYPFSGTTFRTLAADLRAYDKTKSALHFGPDTPLPLKLVRKLLKARIAETR